MREATRNRFISSVPLPSGNPTSLIIKSKWSLSAVSSAECMSWVAVTLCPRASSNFCRTAHVSAWSSTSRIRKVRAESCGCLLEPAAFCAGETVLIVKEKVAPRLMPSLLAIREAPWACVSDLQIASPKPRPPKRSFKERSPCSNGSKILSITSGAIPIPSSCTLIVSCCGDSLVDEIITLPACRLNLKAFLSRFQIICWNLASSAAIWWSVASRLTWSRIFFASASARHISTTLQTCTWASRVARLSSNFPLLIRVRSSRSSIKWLSTAMLRRIISSVERASSFCGHCFCNVSSANTTGVSGVRSSCESMARNLSLVRFADSTNDFWFSKVASASRRSAMPAASAIAVIVSTAVELCRISSDWFWVSITNGPKFCNVPQIAIAETMKIPVAVSRCDKRNAIQITTGPQMNAIG